MSTDTNALDIDSIKETASMINKDPSAFQQWLKGLVPSALDFALSVIIAALVFFIGQKIIGIIRKIVKRGFAKTGTDEGVVQFMDSFVKIALNALLVVIILTMFGVTTASVVAVVGSAGLTVGLALQGSLSNFAGGVLILILKPFVIGDYIKEHSSNHEGTVTAISIFYTTLLTPDHQTIVIPNGTLTNGSITNVMKDGKRRSEFNVSIAYSADIKKAKEVLEMVVRRDEDVLQDEPVIIFVDSLNSSSVDLKVFVWTNADKYWPVHFRMLENMKNALDEAHVEIPFPQVDVHIDNK